MNAHYQNSNDPIADDASCKQEEWEDDYNRVAACNREIAALEKQLGIIAKSKITEARTKSPFIRWEELEKLRWNAVCELTSVSYNLSVRPPAVPLRTIIPAGDDGVLADYIPQPREINISFDEIVPADFLKGLPRLPGRNDSWLYYTGKGHQNSRAKVHLEDKTAPISGDVYLVSSPPRASPWSSAE